MSLVLFFVHKKGKEEFIKGVFSSVLPPKKLTVGHNLLSKWKGFFISSCWYLKGTKF